MAVTMQELETMPVGTPVYYGDAKYVRRDGDWWSIGDDERPMIRTSHFAGFVKDGEILTEDDRIFAVGTTAVGDRYWYVVIGETDAGIIRCTRFYTPHGAQYLGFDESKAGQIADEHSVRKSWLRDHLGPLPPESTGLIIGGLLDRITGLMNDFTAVDEMRAAESRDRKAAESKLTEYDRLRTFLRKFLAEPEPEVAVTEAPQMTPVVASNITYTTATTASAF